MAGLLPEWKLIFATRTGTFSIFCLLLVVELSLKTRRLCHLLSLLSPAGLLSHRHIFFDAIFVTATSSKVVLLGYCEVMVALQGSADSLVVVCEGPGVPCEWRKDCLHKPSRMTVMRRPVWRMNSSFPFQSMQPVTL